MEEEEDEVVEEELEDELDELEDDDVSVAESPPPKIGSALLSTIIS